MKTAIDRAKEFVGNPVMPESVKEAFIQSVVRLVKEVDRDTRHACAGNIQNMDYGYAAKTNRKVVSVDKAFNVVMNTKAV